MRTQTVKLLWIAGLLTSSMETVGQSSGNSIYNNPEAATPQKVRVTLNAPAGNQIYLQAEVMINLKATSYSVIFSATQNGETASQTDSLMNDRLKMVIDGLRRIGIKEREIHIDVISMVPTYSLQLEEKRFSKLLNEVPTGFQLKKNIHILFNDHDRLSDIVAQMARAEVYDIVRVDYNLSDIQAAYDSLRSAAVQIVKMKELQYPKLGLALIPENMSDGFNVAYPIERYASYTAFYTGSSIEEVRLAKRKKEQSKNVYVTGKNPTININATAVEDDDTEFIVKYTNKSKTIYYNRIPYNQFDLIMNADFVEPRIQIYYTLQVRYTVMNAEKYNAMKEHEKEGKKSKGLFKS